MKIGNAYILSVMRIYTLSLGTGYFYMYAHNNLNHQEYLEIS